MGKQRKKRPNRSSRASSSSTSPGTRGRKYTAGELFMAALGLVILVIAAGVVITAILE